MATTKITKGKSFARAISYDLKNGLNKADQNRIAQLPATKGDACIPGFEKGQRARLIGTNLIESETSDYSKQFNAVAKQRPGISEPVHKVSINLKPNEHFDPYRWFEIGQSYLEHMGYENSPYLIVEHREKDHEHIHIVTSRIDFNGDVVSDSLERKRARVWARQIEKEFDLTKTKELTNEKSLTRIEIEQAEKTKTIPPKMILQEAIKNTLIKHQEASAFVETLEEQNISVITRVEKKNQIVGISFGLDGRKFKGSHLGTIFTWEGLKKQGLNYEHERDYGRLEEASQRAREGKSGAGNKQESPSKGKQKLNQEIGSDRDFSDRSKIDDRQIRKESGDKKDGIDSREEFISAGQSERDTTSVESISDDARAEKPITGNENGEFTRGDETELRRFRGFDSGETGSTEETQEGEYEESLTTEINRIIAQQWESRSISRTPALQGGYLLQPVELWESLVGGIYSGIHSPTSQNAPNQSDPFRTPSANAKMVEEALGNRPHDFGNTKRNPNGIGNNRRDNLGNNQSDNLVHGDFPRIDPGHDRTDFINRGDDLCKLSGGNASDTRSNVRSSSVETGLLTDGLREKLDKAAEIIAERLEREEQKSIREKERQLLQVEKDRGWEM